MKKSLLLTALLATIAPASALGYGRLAVRIVPKIPMIRVGGLIGRVKLINTAGTLPGPLKSIIIPVKLPSRIAPMPVDLPASIIPLPVRLPSGTDTLPTRLPSKIPAIPVRLPSKIEPIVGVVLAVSANNVNTDADIQKAALRFKALFDGAEEIDGADEDDIVIEPVGRQYLPEDELERELGL